jgi:hypothetical protein
MKEALSKEDKDVIRRLVANLEDIYGNLIFLTR